MTKAKREEQIKALKQNLTKPLPSKDAIKDARKGLRKLEDRFFRLSKAVSKKHPEAGKLAKQARDSMPYERVKDDRETWDALGKISYLTQSYISVGQIEERILPALKVLDSEYPEIVREANKIVDVLIDEETFILNLRAHISEEEAALTGNTAEQFFRAAVKRGEMTEKKREAFRAFVTKLKDWKPAEIKGDQLYVNGAPVQEGTTVGVMIGSGNRVHLMPVSIGTNIKGEKVILLSNHTQWRRSSLVILDVASAIPPAILSEV